MKIKILFIILFSFSFFFESYSQTENSNKSSIYEKSEKNPPKYTFPLAFTHAESPLIFTNINITNNPAPQNEPAVKISRKDPRRVVAAWRDFRLGIEPNARRRVAYSYSADSGNTWAVSVLLDSTLIGDSYFLNTDPFVTVDTAGNFYIGVISLSTGTGTIISAVYKSTDGGVTFPVAYIASNNSQEADGEYCTSDLSSRSLYKNNLYMSWANYANSLPGLEFSKSTNGGLNWSAPLRIGLELPGSRIATGQQGEVYIVWGLPSTNPCKVWFNKSTDGGNTFGTERVISTGTLAGNLPNATFTYPSIAVGPSVDGTNKGLVYVTFCDARNGDADIFFMRSLNKGETWSSPVRVNNDQIGNHKLQYWPTIAVNEQGIIAILFMDNRNTTDSTFIEAWIARSADGGNTFSNELISTQQSTTQISGNQVRFGEYVGIDYVGDKIIPVWTDERAGGVNMEIYTAMIVGPIGIIPVSTGIPLKFELKQNYPNPFNPGTTIWFSVPKPAYITLSIYNSLGQILETRISESLNPGSFSIRWNAGKYPCGVYFYKLISSDGFIDTKKMILIK